MPNDGIAPWLLGILRRIDASAEMGLELLVYP